MKRGFTNLLQHSLEQVSNFIEITNKTITKQMIKKTFFLGIFLHVFIGLFN